MGNAARGVFLPFVPGPGWELPRRRLPGVGLLLPRPLVAILLAASICPSIHPAIARAAAPPPRESEIQGLREGLRAGHYADVESRTRRLLAAMTPVGRADSLHEAEVLDVLAEALRRGGKAGDPEAEEVCLRALRIKEQLLPADDARVAATLHNLGALYYARGAYPQSLDFLNRALRMREVTLGRNHPDVAATLLVIASVRSALGEEGVARAMVERAVAIQEGSLGPNDPDLGWGLNSLAVLTFNTGDYLEAEPLQERSLEIFQKAYGPNHVMVGTCLHNLATLRYAMGDYREARTLFERALKIRERALGRDHPVVAYTLAGLAMDLEALRDYAGAKARYERALKIQEKAYGPEHDEVGWTLMRIGELHIEIRKYPEARRLLERALACLERGLGPEHPYVAEDLVGLAVATAALGDTAAARAHFERALKIQERVLGPAHPEVGLTRSRFAGFLAQKGDSAEGIDEALKADAILREHLRLTCRGLPERRAIYAASRTPPREVALAIAASMSRTSPETIARVWDSVIRARALVLDELAARERLVGDLARYANALASARERLANLLVRGPGDDAPEHYRSLVDQARAAAERAEQSLAGASAAFRSDRARSDIGLVEVAASLPRNSALVAFVAYGDRDRRTYLALVMPAGAGNPLILTIGRALDVDRLVSQWDAAVSRGARTEESRLASAEAECNRVGLELRRNVWDPIAARVGPVERVFIVPEGALHLVDWAALPGREGGYLVEDGPLLHTLSTERDLVHAGGERRAGEGLLAVGGPAFDEEQGPAVEVKTSQEGRAKEGTLRGPDEDCAELSSVRFDALPQSLREVEEVSALWPQSAQAVVLTGAKATESAFKQRAPGRRVLHLATHGFFLRESCVQDSVRTRGIGGVTTSEEAQTGRAPDDEQNLLLLAGLAFAGANRRQRTGFTRDDGVLMAQEVSSLDLSGVEWAVLSGCDTGVGQIWAGEGVLGLRRAFQVAGVSTVIMSLWPVADEAARAWMQELYRGRLKRHLGTAEAVREANLGVLRERRAQARSTHPFFWACFMAAGDWR